MKGVILAGGLGTRLAPLTKVTNKHLLPVYDKPMIFYPLETLRDAGIDEVLLITGGKSAGDFMQLIGDGADFGLRSVQYAYQKDEGGIAHALALAEHFAAGEKICVVLGDNIIEKSIRSVADDFRAQKRGARILLKEVPDPQRFGVPLLDGERVTRIVEKPQDPPSSYAVIGVYFYDAQVFDLIRQCSPSQRGELEITDVNNFYIEQDSMRYGILEGWWTDAGTFDSLLKANTLVAARARGESKGA